MRYWIPLLALAGCTKDDDQPVQINCEVQDDNALRVDCQSSKAVAFSYESGEKSRKIEVEGAFTLSGMAPNATWVWSAGGATGAFTTDALPDGIPGVSASGEGTVPYVFFATGGYAIIADSSGEVVWYQLYENGWTIEGGISGFDFTAQETVLVVANNVISERTLSGEEIVHIEREDRPLHHDVFNADGLTYALNASLYSYPAGDFVIDGLYIYDGPDRVAEWDLADHLSADPEVSDEGLSLFWGLEFPGAEDYAHTNGVFAAPDGTILLSLRHENAIWALHGVDSPEFGTVKWVLGGNDSDFAITSEVTEYTELIGQHHPRISSNGVVTAFDNRLADNARTVAYAIDESSWSAEITEVHPMGETCSVQGANYPLQSGNVLATCGEKHRITEIATDDTVLWELQVDTVSHVVARGIPIQERPSGW